SAMPWPLRWAGVAIVLGFCAAISLWAFEFGKSLAGLETGAKEELVRLRADAAKLREERDKTQSVVNTSASLITTERVASERLTAQLKQLEAENRALRDDLGFFEKLIPASGTEGVAIRALQGEVLGGTQLKWQLLVIQPVKNAPEFRGKLEMKLSGTLEGRPWMMELPGGAQALQFRQYRRVEGMVDLPPHAVVKNVSAKVMEGSAVRAVQSVKL
ncbi:MAG TPA: DUF6776 family protein, partial [Ramlibacter sp.]|nr:DUF6776 family protein [Ramlibacter sp.]